MAENVSIYVTENVVLQRETGMSPREVWSVCLLVSWSFGLPFYGVLVRPTQIWFHSPLAEPGPAADSRFYLMWTSRVGFQCWLQHMISIMTKGGTHAGG